MLAFRAMRREFKSLIPYHPRVVQTNRTPASEAENAGLSPAARTILLAASFNAQDAALRTRRRGLNSFSGHHGPHARWTRATVLTWNKRVRFLRGSPFGRRERRTLARLLSGTLAVRIRGRPPTRHSSTVERPPYKGRVPRSTRGAGTIRRGKGERGAQRTATAPRPLAARVRISPSPPFFRRAFCRIEAGPEHQPTGFDSLALLQLQRRGHDVEDAE